MARDEGARLHIEVVYCARPGHCDLVTLQLTEGGTLLDAVRSSGLMQRHGLDALELRAGIWSRVQPLDTLLRDRDRVEIYRGLQVDPKEARRLRYKSAKGIKST